MPNRYLKSKIFKDQNGKRYLNRVEYPPIPLLTKNVLPSGENSFNNSCKLRFFSTDACHIQRK